MRSQGQPSVMAHAAGEHGVIDADFDEVDANGGRGGGGGALATVRQTGMQRIQTQYMTAMRCEVKRDMEQVQKSVVREAGLAGEDFMYSWTQGKGKDRSVIEGVSIDGAMILSRNFGNCIPEIEIVEDAPTYWMFRATFIDLETGTTLPRLFRKSKSGVHGKHDAERKLDIALQIGQSKAQRNVIVKAMPTYLVTAAIAASKRSAAAAIKDVPKAIADAIATFAKEPLRVTLAELETFLGATKDHWNAADIVRLRATYRAISDRQTTVEQEFRPAADEYEAPAVTTPDKAAAAAAAAAQAPPAAETNLFTGEVHDAPAAPATTAPVATSEAPAPDAQAASPPTATTVGQAVADVARAATAPTPEATPPKETNKKKRDREPGEEG